MRPHSMKKNWLDTLTRHERMQTFAHLLGLKLKKRHPELSDLVFAHPSQHTPQQFHLDTIVVNKGARKKGVGSAVMNDIGKYADKHKLLMTLTLADKGKYWGTTSKERLRKFYTRQGWRSNRGKFKKYDISMFADMYRNPKNESLEESRRFKVRKQSTKDSESFTFHHTPELPDLKGTIDVEVFPDYSGKKRAEIAFGLQKKTGGPFSTAHSDIIGHSHARYKKLLNTVKSVVKYTIRKHSPDIISYSFYPDEKDEKLKRNRKQNIYRRLLRDTMKKHGYNVSSGPYSDQWRRA